MSHNSSLCLEAIDQLIDQRHMFDGWDKETIVKAAKLVEKKAEPMVADYGVRISVKWVIAKAMEKHYGGRDTASPSVKKQKSFMTTLRGK